MAGTQETVFITGLTGRTGTCFCELLAAQRGRASFLRFVAVARAQSDTAAIMRCPVPIELVTGDITDEASLAGRMRGADTLLHIAGIHWSEGVVRAAVAAGIKRLILVHTTGIYSKYKSAGEEYRRIDAVCERLAAEAGASLTVLRPTMIYGDLDDQNVSKFIRMVDRLPVMPVVSGARFALQPVHREDLAAAYLDVLIHPDETRNKQYVLSGERPILLREMLAEIAGCLGKRICFFSTPYAFAIAGAWALYLLSFSRADYREKVQRLVEPRAYPHDEAARDFGYCPMPFSAGIRREVERYLDEKRIKAGA